MQGFSFELKTPWDNGQLRHSYLLSGIIFGLLPRHVCFDSFSFSLSADAAFNNVWKPYNDRSLFLMYLYSSLCFRQMAGVHTGLTFCYSSEEGWLFKDLLHQFSSNLISYALSVSQPPHLISRQPIFQALPKTSSFRRTRTFPL